MYPILFKKNIENLPACEKRAYSAFSKSILGIVNSFGDSFRVGLNKRPPVAAWARQDGPKTEIKEDNQKDGDSSALISLPYVNKHGGVCVWASLGHEVAGHAFIGSIPNLLQEISNTVKNGKNIKLKDYWVKRVKELTCDILATLCLGPAALISSYWYLKTVEGLETATNDSYHLGFLRIFGMLKVLEIFKEVSKTSKVIAELKEALESEFLQEEKSVVIGKSITYATLVKSVNLVFVTILNQKMKVFNSKPITNFISWSKKDQFLSEIAFDEANSVHYRKNIKSPHILAGAVLKFSEEETFLTAHDIFEQMISLLENLPEN